MIPRAAPSPGALQPRRAVRLPRVLPRFLRRDDGTASVEFMLFLPALITLFVSTFEIGLLMTRQVMLERAVDISVRSLRLGTMEDPTHDSFKVLICARSVIIPDCEATLLLELRPVSKVTWEPLSEEVVCVDREEEIAPSTQFSPGTDNEMMLVRACAIFDPIFPTIALGALLPKDASGGYAITASSAFVNEPS